MWMGLCCLLLVMGSMGTINAIETSVAAEIDNYRAVENQPLPGTLTITHDSDKVVNENSVLMNNKPLKVDLIRVVPLPPGPGELTLYSFEIPAKPKGLYLLPSVSVEVGGKRYSSIGTSYEVSGKPSSNPAYTVIAAQPPAVLKLQATIDGPTTLYPKQHTRFVYKILFSGNIELTTENLPLLEATGFEKIGDVQVTESEENGLNVQLIVQEVRAVKPGDFFFPASKIEGLAYIESGTKQRVYVKPKLIADAPAIKLTVLPFPIAGKPAIFNGAVGDFTISSTLLTPPTVALEDEMRLAIQISGLGDLRTVSLPDLSNFRPLFRLDESGVTSKIENGIKTFVVTIAPLTTAVREIPSIQFAFFNPSFGVYTTLNTSPIPIVVKERVAAPPPSINVNIPLTSPPPEEVPVVPAPAPLPPTATPTPPPSVAPPVTPPATPLPPKTAPVEAIEIRSIEPLTLQDLSSMPFGTWSVFWLIPFGLVLLLLQLALKRYLAKRQENVPQKTSLDLWKEAWRAPATSSDRYQLMTEAFLKRLKERGEIFTETMSVEDLSKTGTVGRVRELLLSLEAQRYAGQQGGNLDEVFEQAKQLFVELGGNMGGNK